MAGTLCEDVSVSMPVKAIRTYRLFHYLFLNE